MAVAQMYHHIAPHNELTIIAKPLIRLLKSHSEVQNIVLSNIATISAERPVSGCRCGSGCGLLVSIVEPCMWTLKSGHL